MNSDPAKPPPPLVVGLGEILWDILPDGARHLGGAPMNVAVHARALGCAAAMISAVGDDALGRAALDRLEQNFAVDCSAVQLSNAAPTGTVQVKLTKGQPDFDIVVGVAWDNLRPEPIARSLLSRAAAVCFGTLAQRDPRSRAAIESLLDGAPADCLRLFDVNLRPPHFADATIRASVDRCNVLKVNDAELPTVLRAIGCPEREDWAELLFADYPRLRLAAVTRGASGSSLYTPAAPAGHHLAAPQVAVADTIGAGDAFSAALLQALLLDAPLETAHQRASRLAAYVCSQPGATPPLPNDWRIPDR